MRQLISRVRRWWTRPAQPAADEPYDVACPCGQHARGLRRARHQVVRCLACGGSVFVLGHSPLAESSTDPRTAGSLPRRYWLGPAIAAGLTLAVVVLVFIMVIPALAPPAPPAETAGDDVRQLVRAGREALGREDFRIAVDCFGKARRWRETHPDSLSPAEGRELTRLDGQAKLVADLLSESLDEILQRTAGTREEERQLQFDRRYRDKAVIFDDVVARDAAGRVALTVFEVRAPGEPARVELNDLKLMAKLPLAEPRRMLFGARLAGLEREERGGHGSWVIRLDPESGVLLTDEEVAGACCPRPLDAELRSVLARQADWAVALP